MQLVVGESHSNAAETVLALFIWTLQIQLGCGFAVFVQPRGQPRRAGPRVRLRASTIDYQYNYGRGVEHLSADLHEGDVVVYQTGSWYVDGVEVGEGLPPSWQYCLVDTIQIVWSHNCEHGVVRGFPVLYDDDDDESITGIDKKANHNGFFRVLSNDGMIDFGPEQLVARIPAQVDTDLDHEGTILRCLAGPLSYTFWEQAVAKSLGFL